MNEPRTWLNEFGPDYEIPSEILNLEGIEDLSWHNDEMPSFGLIRTVDGHLQDIRIWVGYPNPERCHYRSGRYFVALFRDDWQEMDDRYLGDDMHEAIRAFMEALPDFYRLVRG